MKIYFDGLLMKRYLGVDSEGGGSSGTVRASDPVFDAKCIDIQR